jgi:hypothetical protein
VASTVRPSDDPTMPRLASFDAYDDRGDLGRALDDVEDDTEQEEGIGDEEEEKLLAGYNPTGDRPIPLQTAKLKGRRRARRRLGRAAVNDKVGNVNLSVLSGPCLLCRRYPLVHTNERPMRCVEQMLRSPTQRIERIVWGLKNIFRCPSLNRR